MKKLIALVPGAIATIALLGCTQQHSTAPAAASDNAPATTAPAPAGGDTNTFGESKDQAAGSASAARDASMSTDSASQSSTAEPKSDAAADSKSPQ